MTALLAATQIPVAPRTYPPAAATVIVIFIGFGLAIWAINSWTNKTRGKTRATNIQMNSDTPSNKLTSDASDPGA